MCNFIGCAFTLHTSNSCNILETVNVARLILRNVPAITQLCNFCKPSKGLGLAAVSRFDIDRRMALGSRDPRVPERLAGHPLYPTNYERRFNVPGSGGSEQPMVAEAGNIDRSSENVGRTPHRLGTLVKCSSTECWSTPEQIGRKTPPKDQDSGES